MPETIVAKSIDPDELVDVVRDGLDDETGSVLAVIAGIKNGVITTSTCSRQLDRKRAIIMLESFLSHCGKLRPCGCRGCLAAVPLIEACHKVVLDALEADAKSHLN